MAALMTNRRYGEDADKDPMTLHRVELRRSAKAPVSTDPATAAEHLREQTA